MKSVSHVGRKLTVSSLVVAIGVTGCATTKMSDGTSASTGGCNPAIAAGVGALVGALLGGKSNRGSGAAVGAGVGALACVAWNYNVRQTKTAEQVNSAYRAANNGALPAQPQVVRYDVSSAPSSTISAGSPIVIASTIAVVQGAGNSSPPVVEQELIVGHDGKMVSQARKRANEGQGAGEYESQFKVNLPQGVPQGDYPVYTALYINGAKVQQRNLTVQIVMSDTGDKVALLRE